MRSANHIDEDDFFKDTRMSFGDHLEVLRVHLWRAIAGLIFCMVIGFVLDAIGKAIDQDKIGIGRPLMDIIEQPVRLALNDYYDKRMERFLKKRAQANTVESGAAEYQEVKMRLSREDLAKIRGVPADQVPEESIEISPFHDPLGIYTSGQAVERIIRPRELTTLSAQESFVIYFKVSLIAGLVIASPWVFWQIWSFVAAGLYPHEKRYVHIYLPVSLGLFITGVLLCQFVVMPRTVSALLYFNDYIGVTPDLRLSEWLTLAIMMPAIFGVSFQTPLVMLFLERIGIMSIQSYKKRRKIAIFVMAVFAMIVTPTPDALTMCFLWIPMCLLYELGIWLCYFSPSGGWRRNMSDVDVPESEELIEV